MSYASRKRKFESLNMSQMSNMSQSKNHEKRKFEFQNKSNKIMKKDLFFRNFVQKCIVTLFDIDKAYSNITKYHDTIESQLDMYIYLISKSHEFYNHIMRLLDFV